MDLARWKLLVILKGEHSLGAVGLKCFRSKSMEITNIKDSFKGSRKMGEMFENQVISREVPLFTFCSILFYFLKMGATPGCLYTVENDAAEK